MSDGDKPKRQWYEARRTMAPSGAPPSKTNAWIGRITLLTVVVGLVVLLLADLGDRGPTGPPVGSIVPDFAAPLVSSPADRRVNLLTRASDGAPRACDVRRADVLNVCALREQGPFVLAFFAADGDECVRQLDVLDDLRARHPDVSIAAVAVRGDREELQTLTRERGWGFPVGHDEEGFLVGVYGVAVCPQLVFGLPGGRILDTTYGELSAPELDAQLSALARRAG